MFAKQNLGYEHQAYIGVGSNLNQPRQRCEQAVNLLRIQPQIIVSQVSSLYESEPMVLEGKNPDEYPWYTNAVIEVKTDLNPYQLFKTLKAIERQMGRSESPAKWEPRVIDLDLLFYDHLVFKTDELTVPHPGIAK